MKYRSWFWTFCLSLCVTQGMYFARAEEPCAPNSNPSPHPHTSRTFMEQLKKEFSHILNFDDVDNELDVAENAVDHEIRLGANINITGYIRAYSRMIMMTQLSEIAAIENTQDVNLRRARAYEVWEESRIAYSILTVYMRKLLYDRDFRDQIYTEHGHIQLAMVESFSVIKYLREQVVLIRKAIDDANLLPSSHPMHGLTKETLEGRVGWIAHDLLTNEVAYVGTTVKFIASDYTEVVRRFRDALNRHEEALSRLWKILQKDTWTSSRWTFRTRVMLQVLRLRYANANFWFKVFLPTAVAVSSSIAMFGDWLNIGGAIEGLRNLFQNTH